MLRIACQLRYHFNQRVVLSLYPIYFNPRRFFKANVLGLSNLGTYDHRNQKDQKVYKSEKKNLRMLAILMIFELFVTASGDRF